MKSIKIALAIAALMAAGPAAYAVAGQEGPPPHGKAKGHDPEYAPAEPPTPGPKDGLPAQAKAYGRYCKGESKKHVKGEKGTAFSRCVKNMAKAATQKSKAPGQICKGESKKHVKGEKGTAFSRCVNAVVALRKQEREKEKEAAV